MSFEIHRYTHFILIQNPPVWLYPHLDAFTEFYTQQTMGGGPKGKFQKAEPGVKIFASVTNSEYRFHINQASHLIWYLKNQGIDKYTVINHELQVPAPLNAPIRAGWAPRENQLPYMEHMLADVPNRSRLVAAATGHGKTSMAMMAISQMNYRCVIVILPTYIEKWIGDIQNILQVDATDIMVVQGTAALKGLIGLAQEGVFNSPFTIISSRTLQMYISAYESHERDGVIEEYGIKPDELWPLLQAGILLIDENHQHIHAMFKILLHTHIHRLIGLTATLISDNPIVDRVHKVMYPPKDRMTGIELKKYIDVTALSYKTEFPEQTKLQTSEYGQSHYSHNAYEKSILRKPHLTSNYLKIIDHAIRIKYLDDYMPGDKLAIFASTIDMCDKIVAYLKFKYPDRDIRRYCEQDPYENAIEAEWRVTTIISMGTAIDIPGLRVSIMTNSITSSPANIQVLGRLRELKDRDVKFVYLYNESIPKQVSYHIRKIELFKPRVKSHVSLRSPHSL